MKKSSGEVNIFARRVVSGAGVKNTFKFMLPGEVSQKNRTLFLCRMKVLILSFKYLNNKYTVQPVLTKRPRETLKSLA